MIVLRRPRRWITLTWFATFVVMLPFALVRPDPDYGRAVGVAICVLGAVVTWRAWVSRVEVTADAVVVVNGFGARRIPLADVEDVTVDWHDVYVVLTDGTKVDVEAFGLGPRDFRSARRWRRREYERLVAAIQLARDGSLPHGVKQV